MTAAAVPAGRAGRRRRDPGRHENLAAAHHPRPGRALAAAAAKQRLSHKAFLAEALTAECDERDARRRIRLVHEAKFPRTKRLADFDHSRIPDLTPAILGHLAAGAWIDTGEPLVLLGDSGTGKTHLLIALGTCAAEARPAGPLPDLRPTGQRARRSRRRQTTLPRPRPLRPARPALPRPMPTPRLCRGAWRGAVEQGQPRFGFSA